MTNIFAYIFNNIYHLRDCPDAEQRDKIENILKTRREERQSNAAAEAGADGVANVNDRADSICWFCHADVTHLENNKCAGCRKVRYTPRLQMLRVISRYFSNFLD